MKKFITREYKGKRTDPNTGEIYEYSEVKEVVKTDQEPFFFTYSRQIMALYGSNVFNASTKVLWKLLEFAEFNTGKIYMNAERVEEIMTTCGISRTSYHRAINDLVEIGIITKNKTTFTIAENMFWKGDKKAREDIINAKLMVSFSPVFDDEEQKEQDD
jgi:hypothetical protein